MSISITAPAQPTKTLPRLKDVALKFARGMMLPKPGSTSKVCLLTSECHIWFPYNIFTKKIKLFLFQCFEVRVIVGYLTLQQVWKSWNLTAICLKTRSPIAFLNVETTFSSSWRMTDGRFTVLRFLPCSKSLMNSDASPFYASDSRFWYHCGPRRRRTPHPA